MHTPVINPVRRISWVAGLGIALLAGNAAISGEQPSSSSMACAERETLLMMLIEAHGAVPNPASDRLAMESVSLHRMRTACDNGGADDAVALYDRLIAALTMSAAQKN